MRLRFTLGATQGGMIEWFNENSQTWIVEGDFRDGNLGIAPQGTSATAMVRLGWLSLGVAGGAGNGNTNLDDATGVARDGVFIDDIVVYTPATGSTDANGDGMVDGADLWLLQQNNPALIPQWRGDYGGPPSIGASAGLAAVPEPGTMSLLIMGAMACCGRLRRGVWGA